MVSRVQSAFNLCTEHIIYPTPIYICVDNQNALRALTGGPTLNRECMWHIRSACHALTQFGCQIKATWTPSHCKIPGNETADRPANDAHSKPLCQWARLTLNHLTLLPKQQLHTQWYAITGKQGPATS